ncbi:MAG: FAD:protein FMN transferase [Sulfuricurvum sp.]|nr:FAD:protein FMN transferase [Sulfuricurvum sp.]
MKNIWLFLVLGVMLFANERTQVHMGTMISVQVDDYESSDAVFELFKKLDNTLSTYKDDSEISLLNRTGNLVVTPYTQKILERSLEMSDLSNGAFDVTIGALSHDTYHFGRDEKLPNTHDIHKALEHVGAQKLILQGNHAYLLKGAKIDLGGIGKGYAVDLSIELLHKHSIDRAVVAASGDIGCIGPCDVAITNPFHPDTIYKTLRSSLSRFAISTSGNYERYIKNKSHNHLLDPKTGKSEHIFASVTLYGSGDNTKLDALATAVSIMPLESALSFLQSHKIAYVLMLNDGRIFQSPIPEGVTWLE